MHTFCPFLSGTVGLDALTQLRLLELGDNRISVMENLSHLKELRRLFLGANRIALIAGLESLVNLEVLSLLCNCITEIRGQSDRCKCWLHVPIQGWTFRAGQSDRGLPG